MGLSFVCGVFRIQKHIIRILLMPVIYAIDCYASLVWHDGHMYLHLIREQYEAYTVWSFQVRPFNPGRGEQRDVETGGSRLPIFSARFDRPFSSLFWKATLTADSVDPKT